MMEGVHRYANSVILTGLDLTIKLMDSYIDYLPVNPDFLSIQNQKTSHRVGDTQTSHLIDLDYAAITTHC